MKKEVRRCKYIVPLSSGNEVFYALNAFHKAKELTIDLRAEINQLANQFVTPRTKAIFEREVGHLTDLLISLALYKEKVICNITTEEVDE